MEIKEIYPVGLVDCRIINNKINIVYFETNKTLGIRTKFFNVKPDIKYKIKIKINGDVNNYIVCKDKENNQIGTKQLIKKEGNYEIIYSFDSYMSVSFFILCDQTYTNQIIRLNLLLIDQSNNKIVQKIKNKEKIKEFKINNNKILIVSSGIPQNNIYAYYAYNNAKYLKINKYKCSSLFLDNEAVYQNHNIDYDSIQNIEVAKVIREDKFFIDNKIKSGTLSLYSSNKSSIIENLEGEPDFIFCYDQISIIVSRSMFQTSKIINMFENSPISLYLSDQNKEYVKNYPVLFEGKYLDYEKKNKILIFSKKDNINKDDYEDLKKIKYDIEFYNQLTNLEKKISESNIVILYDKNILNELIIRMCNYYYTNILINPNLEEIHLVYSKYHLKKISKQIPKLINNTDDLIKYNYKDFSQCLNLFNNNKFNPKILVYSHYDTQSYDGLKMYYLFNLLKKHNIDTYGLFNGEDNNIFNLDSCYNINLNEITLNKFLSTVNNFTIIISNNVEFINLIKDKNTNINTEYIIYTTEKLINNLTLQTLNILENNKLIIENNNTREKLEEFSIKNYIENDLSYLNKITFDKEIFYDIGIIINEQIIKNHKQLILNLINNNYFNNQILIIQNKNYKLEKFCSYDKLIFKTIKNDFEELELCQMCSNIIIFDQNQYQLLIHNSLNRNLIIDNLLEKDIVEKIINNSKTNTNFNSNTNLNLNEFILLNYITKYLTNNKLNNHIKKEYIINIEEQDKNKNFINDRINDKIFENINNHRILENEYVEKIYSSKEFSSLNIIIINKNNQNKKYQINNKYINNITIFELNDVEYLKHFDDGEIYYFIDNNYQYHNLINENKISYLYLTTKPKKIINYNYNYIINKKKEYIQYLFPNSNII